MSSTTKASGAELIVAQLSSLDQEEVHRNAEKKVVHSVIKNIPFSIVLGLRGTFDPYAVDFHKFTLNSTLLYDTHGEERIVDWVKSSPIDCVVQVNETGERATAEVRLQSLSSQHEDMAFRIKFTAEPPSSSNLQPLVVVTEPKQAEPAQEEQEAPGYSHQEARCPGCRQRAARRFSRAHRGPAAPAADPHQHAHPDGFHPAAEQVASGSRRVGLAAVSAGRLRGSATYA
jgi:hypothetical protein